MLIASILLGVAAVAAPAETPLPTPIPAVRAGTGQTRTLADVARERRLGIAGVKGGTLSITGSDGGYIPSAAAAASRPAVAAPIKSIGVTPEPWIDAVAFDDAWRARAQAGRDEIAAAQEAESRASAAMPVVTFSGRGSAAAQALSDQTRAAALLPYREKTSEALEKFDKLKIEAAKAGVPGLVR